MDAQAKWTMNNINSGGALEKRRENRWNQCTQKNLGSDSHISASIRKMMKLSRDCPWKTVLSNCGTSALRNKVKILTVLLQTIV